MLIILYIAMLGTAGLHLMHYYPLLPEKMATHFDAAGQPNGWMTRDGFAMFYIGLLAFMLAVIYGVTGLLSKFPKLANIPNREYWMATERQAETVASLRKAMIGLGLVIGASVIGIHHLVITTSLQEKPVLNNTIIYCFIGVFLAYVIGFVLWNFIRFRKPDPSA